MDAGTTAAIRNSVRNIQGQFSTRPFHANRIVVDHVSHSNVHMHFLFICLYSLMKPQKYAACRSTKENQTVSTITNEEQRHTGNNAVQHSNIYEVDQSTQVKTYTDHGNGYGQRSGGTTHYSKVNFCNFFRHSNLRLI